MKDLVIQWLIRRDMRDVLDIESRSFADPWCEDEFLAHLRDRATIAMVAKCPRTDRVRAYVVYKLHKGFIELLNMAVDPDYRKRKIGKKIIDRLKAKLVQQRREALEFVVHERWVGGQCFLRSQGFKCRLILSEEFDDLEDGYVMTYFLPDESEKGDADEGPGTNRLASIMG